jgi:hypothetical protein
MTELSVDPPRAPDDGTLGSHLQVHDMPPAIATHDERMVAATVRFHLQLHQLVRDPARTGA